MPAAPVKKSAVGGVGNGLGHDGGAYDNPLCVGLLDDTTAPGGIDAGRQRRLHVFFNALSPAREAGRVDGQLGLQVGLTAEELPVRVLHPDLDPGLVRGVEGVLRVQQASHQARSLGWAATTEGERHREGALDLLPVEHRGQPDQVGASCCSARTALDGTARPYAAARALDSSDSSEQFARKQILAKPYLANSAPINQQNCVSDQGLADCLGRTK